MSSAPPRQSAHNSTSSAFRVNYLDYVADITGSSKTSRKIITTGIGHHINPLHNPYPNRSNQSIQQTEGMPQYGGGTEKCARCSKTVYLAEKKVGAGQSFHNSCFNCYTCGRNLDTKSLSEHKGEIYCKGCYSEQFGPRGLVSGVMMTTERPITREYYSARRSSQGTNLDTMLVKYQQAQQRVDLSGNVFCDSTYYDNLSRKYPQHYEISPEQNSFVSRKSNEFDTIGSTKYHRSPSPKGFERFSGSNINDERHRSAYNEEDDRSKYTYTDEKRSYDSKSSTIADVPIVSYSKQSDSANDQKEMTEYLTRDNGESSSSSMTSNNFHRRQNSRERQNDLTDDYSRSNINTDVNNRKCSNDYEIDTILSDDPTKIRNDYHLSSSYESRYRTTPSTSNLNDQDSPEPQRSEAPPSGLSEFISKINLAENTSPSIDKYSVLGSLIPNSRQEHNPNNYDNFDN